MCVAFLSCSNVVRDDFSGKLFQGFIVLDDEIRSVLIEGLALGLQRIDPFQTILQQRTMGNFDDMRDVFDCPVDVVDCAALFQDHDIFVALDDTAARADNSIFELGNFLIGIRLDVAEIVLSDLEEVGDAFAGLLLNEGIRIDETVTDYIAQ